MIKLNFKKGLYDNKGQAVKQPLTDGTLKEILMNEALSDWLFNAKTSNKLKFHCWSIDLFKIGTIAVDITDFNILYSFIEKIENSAGIIAPFLQLMNEAKQQK